MSYPVGRVEADGGQIRNPDEGILPIYIPEDQ